MSSDSENQPAGDTILFADFDLSQEVQLAIQMAGYTSPTPIQAQIIPPMLEGKDVLAQSQTGSGKTAAFALPILSRLNLKNKPPQVLVLAPTRELATQVAQSFESYGQCIPKLRVTAIYGGADYAPQLRALKKAPVVVGTPGRIIDHIKRGSLQLDAIKCLVLDEADEMLNMGFVEDVNFILSKTSEEKQTALFSATMPDQIRQIASNHLQDPVTIRIKQKSLTADSITQKCVFIEESNKLELLSRMLEMEETEGVIVFTKTKDATVRVAERLSRTGHKATALNGDLPQARRQRAVDQLKAGHLDILVATDVAARGLDVERISHVFNFDLPHDSESYVHRIGRTGRAGRAGTAVIFLTPRQLGKLKLIERATKKTIEVVPPPCADQINSHRTTQFKQTVLENLDSKQIDFFKQLVKDLQEESGRTVDEIAAALGVMSQLGRAMKVKDLPEKEFRSETRGRQRSAQMRDDRSKPHGMRGKPRAGMRRYRLEVGREDGARPGNIVGAIANEAGISGSDIGSIQIGSKSSTVDLPKNVSAEAIARLGSAWVAGKQLRIRPLSGKEEYSSRPGPHSKKRFSRKSDSGDKASFSAAKSGKSGRPKKKKRK